MEVKDILAAWVEGNQRSRNALAPATLKVQPHANLANKHALGQTFSGRRVGQRCSLIDALSNNHPS
jgi:hypothetical protein